MSCINVSVGSLGPDQVRQVLARAEKAPTVRNCRPWEFLCTETTIEMRLDLAGNARSEGTDLREAMVACGAALMNLRLAIRSFGIGPVVHLVPEIDDPTLLASVEIDGRRPITADTVELSLAMGLLDTGAREFETSELPGSVIAKLRSAARIEQAWVALLSASAISELREFVGGTESMKAFDPSAHVVVIGTLQDDPTSWLRGGQAMQRVLLEATTWNLSACFIAMSADPTAGRVQIRHLIGGGLWPQALLQIGRPGPA